MALLCKVDKRLVVSAMVFHVFPATSAYFGLSAQKKLEFFATECYFSHPSRVGA